MIIIPMSTATERALLTMKTRRITGQCPATCRSFTACSSARRSEESMKERPVIIIRTSTATERAVVTMKTRRIAGTSRHATEVLRDDAGAGGGEQHPQEEPGEEVHQLGGAETGEAGDQNEARRRCPLPSETIAVNGAAAVEIRFPYKGLELVLLGEPLDELQALAVVQHPVGGTDGVVHNHPEDHVHQTEGAEREEPRWPGAPGG